VEAADVLGSKLHGIDQGCIKRIKSPVKIACGGEYGGRRQGLCTSWPQYIGGARASHALLASVSTARSGGLCCGLH